MTAPPNQAPRERAGQSTGAQTAAASPVLQVQMPRYRDALVRQHRGSRLEQERRHEGEGRESQPREPRGARDGGTRSEAVKKKKL